MHPALSRIMATVRIDELARTVPDTHALPVRRRDWAHRARPVTTAHPGRRQTARIG
jgi:hypothetical protein